MRLLRDILGPRQELVVLQLSISTFAAAAFALCALGIVFRGGAPTQFSLPEHHVSFVPGPTTRGTVNLISSCVTTIFNCVYVSVHVDLPSSTKSTEFRAEWEGISIPKHLLDVFFSLWDLSANPLVRRVLWMLFNIDAPEIVMYVAMLEYQSATAGKRFMHAIGDTGWTMTHAFFADMGGFEVEDNEGDGQVLSTGEEFYKWRLDHPDFVLDLEAISAEIADRSKSSGLLKMMTCTQASWLVVQTVMRLVEGIPVSELEILTCAYITCALVVYGFWWHKPYDVRRRVVLRPPKRPGRPFTSASLGTPSSGSPGGVPPLSKPFPCRDPAAEGIPNSPSPKATARVPWSPYEKPRTTPFNRAFDDPDSSWLYASYATGLMGAIMGLIHCSLWDTQFTNSRGQMLWRLGCVMQIILPLTAASVSAIEHWYAKRPLYIFLLSVAFFYSVSRTLLLVLVVLSFWSLPADVYSNVNWSIPHWQ